MQGSWQPALVIDSFTKLWKQNISEKLLKLWHQAKIAPLGVLGEISDLVNLL
jgi:hypothetical protein